MNGQLAVAARGGNKNGYATYGQNSRIKLDTPGGMRRDIYQFLQGRAISHLPRQIKAMAPCSDVADAAALGGSTLSLKSTTLVPVGPFCQFPSVSRPGTP